jgi:hypothetical protein
VPGLTMCAGKSSTASAISRSRLRGKEPDMTASTDKDRVTELNAKVVAYGQQAATDSQALRDRVRMACALPMTKSGR